jgi:hypothetical protein
MPGPKSSGSFPGGSAKSSESAIGSAESDEIARRQRIVDMEGRRDTETLEFSLFNSRKPGYTLGGGKGRKG